MKLAGSWTAVVTPFTKGGMLDEEALRRLVQRQLRGGTAGLVPCGSTGEAATLSHEEYRRVIELTLAESRGEVPVFPGISTNSTRTALELARECESLGADGLMLTAPYYNKPTQEGLFQHYCAVAKSTRLPILVYNIPGRTAVNILPSTLLRIVKACPNVVAVKEAAGSLDQVSEILSEAPARFSVLSGDDSLALPMMAVGARGVVSVLSNIAPAHVAKLCATQSSQLHLKAFPLIKALFAETNPIPVKAALEMMGLCRGEPRLPLVPMTEAGRALLRKELKAFGLI